MVFFLSLRAQLAEANSKASLLFAENERLHHDRKHGYHHDKQLEELRNLQEVVQQERNGFEKERQKQQLRLEADREEIRSLQENVEKQKEELKAQKDELERQKETLQKQIDLFQSCQKKARERSQSPKYTLHSAASSSSVRLMENVQHKRSSSDDIQRQGSPFEAMKPEYSHSLKEPLRMGEIDAAAAARSSRSSSSSQLGAINEQQQMLPLKLAGGRGGNKHTATHVYRPTPTMAAASDNCRLMSASARAPSHTISTSSVVSPAQRLPMKLAEVGSSSAGPRTAQQLPLKLASESSAKQRPRSANSRLTPESTKTNSLMKESTAHPPEEIIYF